MVDKKLKNKTKQGQTNEGITYITQQLIQYIFAQLVTTCQKKEEKKVHKPLLAIKIIVLHYNIFTARVKCNKC